MTQARFTIIVDGGVLQAVVSHDPALIGVEFDLIDYDTEGAEDDRLGQIKQASGELETAFIGGGIVEKQAVEIV